MKRIIVRKPGGHSALELIEEPDRPAPPGKVRVRVRAIGVNYADVIVRMGYYEAAKGRYPITPGFEYSGVIDDMGSGVGDFMPGDRVFGITRFGGYTNSITVDPRQLWHCPKEWDFADCAGFPTVYLTAYYGLFKAAKVESGETLLIHSAAGGMGTALLQLAKIAGCRSVAVVGAAHKEALCRDLGAYAVINRSAASLWAEAEKAAPKGFDAVFDANGVTTLRQGFDHLAPGGRLMVYGFAEIFPRGQGRPNFLRMAWNYFRVPKFSPLTMTGNNRAVIGFNVIYLFNRLDNASRYMGDMLRWIDEGKIRKMPTTQFPLERAADAHRALESGSTVGKIILTA